MWLCLGWAGDPTAYLGEVLGDATSTVGVRDLGVLQVHSALAHVLIEQDGPIVTSCGAGGSRVRPCSQGLGSGPWRQALELGPE